jgi:phosphoglycolate phosphatase-like HAD superfamily hydrolase
VPFERIRPLIGAGGDRMLRAVHPGVSGRSAEGRRLLRRVGELFVQHVAQQGLKSTPGARALVERMRDEGLRLVVASDAEPPEVEALLRAADVDDLLDERFTAADLEHSPPLLDLVELARCKIGLLPQAGMLLADTPYDIEAAARAGMRTIALRCGGYGDRDLTGAVRVYDTPADLLARFDISPLHKSARPVPPPRRQPVYPRGLGL